MRQDFNHNPNRSLFDREERFGGFNELMSHRVHKILLVSSPYDSATIAEDERLSEIISSEYLDLSLRWAPQVRRVSTGEEALEKLERERFDIVITMLRVGGMDILSFARRVKQLAPEVPVVLLAYNVMDIQGLPVDRGAAVDYIFLWNGDPKILLSIVKLVEDRDNIDRDIEIAGVQTILLIENSVRFYSVYLPLIYTELMRQTQTLIGEGVNLTHKLLRMRARPKILLATSYEEAQDLYKKYKHNLLGVITDVEFNRNGRAEPQAGIDFAAQVRGEIPDMPILVQSSSDAYAPLAQKAGARFLNKTSKSMLNDLRNFMHDNFGFGDFVFKLPDGTEVDRAHDLHSLVAALRRAPDESVVYHANRNHFSKWLMARTEFEAAYHIRPRKFSEFRDGGELKRYLADEIEGFLRKMQRGVIVEFAPEYFDTSIPYVKIGTGSVGGKARGLAFFNSLLAKEDFSKRFDNVRITIPPLAVLATDYFDDFMEINRLYSLIHGNPDDQVITEAFLSAQLPPRLLDNISLYAEHAKYPLVVRSSSVMEDSQFQPFAGIYETYMLANSHNDFAVRLDQLSRAVKMVYASTFWGQARAYMGATSNLQDEEKMAVILQRLVGRRHGDRFYPSFSGVAQSHNFYPVPPAKPADGTVHVALGLGLTVVEGKRSLRFSPAHPKRLPQFAKIRDYFDSTQKEFMALDASSQNFRPAADSLANILSCPLDQALSDGTLAPVASTYDAENDRLTEGISRTKGTQVVDFAPILQSSLFPLAPITALLLDVGRQAMGCEVEMEFAVDLDAREFNILQIRPMSALHSSAAVEIGNFPKEQMLCRTERALGHGYLSDIQDIIYVKPAAFSTSATRAIAAELGALNSALSAQRRKYALIGPGRWGSGDQFLGIPVSWGQISNAKLIVEVTLPDFMPDPSYGSHFLHNVISLGIGYLLINHLHKSGDVDWAWLDSLPAASESKYLRHVRLEKPLDVRIDSRTGEGVALKPGPDSGK